MAGSSAVDATGASSSANKVSLPRPFSLVCFCGAFRRRLSPYEGAHLPQPTTPDPEPPNMRRMAQDLNYTNVYIFGVRSLRPDRSEDEVNPLTLRALVGLTDILAHSKAFTSSCSISFCTFTSCY